MNTRLVSSFNRLDSILRTQHTQRFTKCVDSFVQIRLIVGGRYGPARPPRNVNTIDQHRKAQPVRYSWRIAFNLFPVYRSGVKFLRINDSFHRVSKDVKTRKGTISCPLNLLLNKYLVQSSTQSFRIVIRSLTGICRFNNR